MYIDVYTVHVSLYHVLMIEHPHQKSFWIFLLAQVSFFISFLVPFVLYLQQFGTRSCHFAWYLLHFGMVTLHSARFAAFWHAYLPFAWYLLHLAIFTFHFEWCLPRFGNSISHLHGFCNTLVPQTFIWIS